MYLFDLKLSMKSIHHKTLQDLEFLTVLETISNYCTTEMGKELALEIEPFPNQEILEYKLAQTSEYNSSFTNNNVIPNHYFDAISHELKFLKIEDSYLDAKK